MCFACYYSRQGDVLLKATGHREGDHVTATSTHHVEATLVFPKRCRVSRAGATLSSAICSRVWMSSMTPRPPVWIRKWLKALEGLGLAVAAASGFSHCWICSQGRHHASDPALQEHSSAGFICRLAQQLCSVVASLS